MKVVMKLLQVYGNGRDAVQEQVTTCCVSIN